MAKRKRDDSEADGRKKVRTRAPRKPTARSKAKMSLLNKKKDLRKQYKVVQQDLKMVDRDLKSLGYTIRSRASAFLFGPEFLRRLPLTGHFSLPFF